MLAAFDSFFFPPPPPPPSRPATLPHPRQRPATHDFGNSLLRANIIGMPLAARLSNAQGAGPAQPPYPTALQPGYPPQQQAPPPTGGYQSPAPQQGGYNRPPPPPPGGGYPGQQPGHGYGSPAPGYGGQQGYPPPPPPQQQPQQQQNYGYVRAFHADEGCRNVVTCADQGLSRADHLRASNMEANSMAPRLRKASNTASRLRKVNTARLPLRCPARAT